MTTTQHHPSTSTTDQNEQADRADRARVALVTGGSAGLGRALVHALTDAGWTVLTDARHPDGLRALDSAGVHTVTGDVSDPAHRERLGEVVDDLGRLDLLVHNASTLGPTPLPALAETTPEQLADVLAVNVLAPLALTTALLPRLRASEGLLVGISSDAAVDHYASWGLYGASKAALDHLIGTLGAENPQLRAYAIDPGDLQTAMHQAAFPGEDISDRPLPEEVVGRILALLDARPASGRYRAADVDVLAAVTGGVR